MIETAMHPVVTDDETGLYRGHFSTHQESDEDMQTAALAASDRPGILLINVDRAGNGFVYVALRHTDTQARKSFSERDWSTIGSCNVVRVMSFGEGGELYEVYAYMSVSR